MKKQNLFKKKGVLALFVIISFILGFLSLGQGKITGNVVVNEYQSFSLLSIIGLLLLFCVIVIALYTIKKK